MTRLAVDARGLFSWHERGFGSVVLVVEASFCLTWLVLGLIDGRMLQSWPYVLAWAGLSQVVLLPALWIIKRTSADTHRHSRLYIGLKLWLLTLPPGHLLGVLWVAIAAGTADDVWGGPLMSAFTFAFAFVAALPILVLTTLAFAPAIAVSAHSIARWAREREAASIGLEDVVVEQ